MLIRGCLDRNKSRGTLRPSLDRHAEISDMPDAASTDAFQADWQPSDLPKPIAKFDGIATGIGEVFVVCGQQQMQSFLVVGKRAHRTIVCVRGELQRFHRQFIAVAQTRL